MHNFLKQLDKQMTIIPFYRILHAVHFKHFRIPSILSCESKKICESIVPIVKPVSGSMARLPLFAGIDL